MFTMRVIDLDTRTEFYAVRYQPMIQTFNANKRGYLIMVESSSEKPLIKTQWGLVILSNPEFPLAHPDDGPLATLGGVQVACDISIPFQPKKYNVLFRYFVDTLPGSHDLSIHCSVNKSMLPDAVIELELFEDGKPILKAEGKLHIFDHLMY